MEFIGRADDLKQLQKIQLQSQEMGRMTVITGRRRIGKTRLILESLDQKPYLYFFVSRTEEKLLCQEFSAQVTRLLGITFYDPVASFQALFARLLEYAKEHHLHLVIDEFQEFYRINPTIYGQIQHLWDRYKDQVKLNLILSGSVKSIMTTIFEDAKEPLFGRATARFNIQAFSLNTLKQVLREKRGDSISRWDLLALYSFTGGVPKYVEQFVDEDQLSYREMLDEIFRPQSFFLEEGRYVLIQEFGKDHTTYFSILTLIASGKTSRQQIESVLQKPIGGYLNQLEKNYQFIQRLRPMFSKPGTQNVRYYLNDNFLRFWFRFIYSNQAAVNGQNLDFLRQKVEADYNTYAGHNLEKLVRQQLIESKLFSQVHHYWERKNQSEIDVIAVNELTKNAIIGEVKMQKKNISVELLRKKATKLTTHLGGYNINFRGYSLEDIDF